MAQYAGPGTAVEVLNVVVREPRDAPRGSPRSSRPCPRRRPHQSLQQRDATKAAVSARQVIRTGGTGGERDWSERAWGWCALTVGALHSPHQGSSQRRGQRCQRGQGKRRENMESMERKPGWRTGSGTQRRPPSPEVVQLRPKPVVFLSVALKTQCLGAGGIAAALNLLRAHKWRRAGCAQPQEGEVRRWLQHHGGGGDGRCSRWLGVPGEIPRVGRIDERCDRP